MLDIVQESGLIKRVVKRVYYSSRYKRLRTQIEEEDLLQMVFLKLLHRDNYKLYSENYPLVGFIYRVANGCAISFSRRKSTQHEYTILDKPTSEEESATLMDFLTSECPNIDMDTQFRLNKVSASMDSSIIPQVVIRYKGEEKPFSIENLFDFFISTLLMKSEIHKYVINKRTNQPVSNITFSKWWSILMDTANRELSTY